MKTWYVVTPSFAKYQYEDGFPISVEDRADVFYLEAETKRDALLLGVKAMIEDHRNYSYCREQRAAGLSPYEGVWVEEEKVLDTHPAVEVT